MSLTIDTSGFTIRETMVQWSEVLSIATYKVDLFSYDDICLAFEVEPEHWIEVSEEEEGFVELMTAIAEQFPGLPQDWYPTVMTPAFERNYCILWRRPDLTHGTPAP